MACCPEISQQPAALHSKLVAGYTIQQVSALDQSESVACYFI